MYLKSIKNQIKNIKIKNQIKNIKKTDNDNGSSEPAIVTGGLSS